MNPQYANLWKRLVASIIDSLVLGIIEFPLSFIEYKWIVYLFSLAVAISYPVYFIGSRGQTLGKIAMKIKVVKEDGSKLDYGTAFFREIIGKFVSSFIGIGLLWAIWDKKKQTWHDMMAGTLVVDAK